MDKRPIKKMNIPMCLAGVLLCLTLISFHFCGGLYARYTAGGAGEDTARVAKFDISDSGAYFSQNLLIQSAPDKPIEKQIEVKNNSEVTVAYIVTIRNSTGNIPYTFSVDDCAPLEDECVATCYLAPGTQKTVKIMVGWSAESALEYVGMVDLIKISICAQQVD